MFLLSNTNHSAAVAICVEFEGPELRGLFNTLLVRNGIPVLMWRSPFKSGLSE